MLFPLFPLQRPLAARKTTCPCSMTTGNWRTCSSPANHASGELPTYTSFASHEHLAGCELRKGPTYQDLRGYRESKMQSEPVKRAITKLERKRMAVCPVGQIEVVVKLEGVGSLRVLKKTS